MAPIRSDVMWRWTLVVALLSGCSQIEADSYTLYRDSPLEANARIHVASFDTSEGEDYNSENCDLARRLFQAQDSVATRFWCEKGRYRP